MKYSSFTVAIVYLGIVSSVQVQRTDYQVGQLLIDVKNIQEYELWEPSLISETITRWAEHYPDLLKLTTAQEAYGLPTAGGDNDCPFSKDVVGCLNHIITIQDFEAHPEGSDSSNRLPEVLWSGELHGNEQVGPTAVLEATQLLLDAATCESHPRMALFPVSDGDAWDRELEKARTCRQDLYDAGIDDNHRQWLARLVSTRRIVVVPTANALGYFQKIREEGRVDPNRDFPYDLTDPKECMKTIAGRTLNEVYREHMFQMSLTFHGGMEMIGYEWGAPTWEKFYSPDDIAQKNIAGAYSRFAGSFTGTPKYEYGPMNDVVYPVRGGMEDWAYAGSFDPERVVQCEPGTYGGYSKNKTIYSNSTLRTFNMLIETSDQKIPSKDTLGSSDGVMSPNNPAGNGHVTRNIRLALLAVDLVEPYVAVTKVGNVTVSDDIVPMVERGERSCQITKTVSIPSNTKRISVELTVGGALEINEVQVWASKWDDIPSSKLDCLSQPSMKDVEEFMIKGEIMGPSSGTGRFSDSGASKPFLASVDMSSFQPGDKIVIITAAKVDQSWSANAKESSPNGMPPQSHVVNVRTNPDWHHKSEGKIIDGRLYWFSIPVTIALSTDKSTESNFIELSDRFANSESKSEEKDILYDIPEPDEAEPVKEALSLTAIFLMLGSTCVCCYIAGNAYLRFTMRATHRDRIRDYIQDPDAQSPGLKDRQQRNNNGYSDEKGVELKNYTRV